MSSKLTTQDLMNAAAYVARQRGASSPGVDGVTAVVLQTDQQRQQIVGQLWAEIGAGSYSPAPLREVIIAKEDGKTRSLGLPTLRDRVVHEAVRRKLEMAIEPSLPSSMYAFRASRGPINAIDDIISAMIATEGELWAVQVDVHDFFGSINHDRLLAMTAQVMP